jgi:hypothetical protein
METFMMGNGYKVLKMDKEHILIQQQKYCIADNGKTEKKTVMDF